MIEKMTQEEIDALIEELTVAGHIGGKYRVKANVIKEEGEKLGVKNIYLFGEIHKAITSIADEATGNFTKTKEKRIRNTHILKEIEPQYRAVVSALLKALIPLNTHGELAGRIFKEGRR